MGLQSGEYLFLTFWYKPKKDKYILGTVLKTTNYLKASTYFHASVSSVPLLIEADNEETLEAEIKAIKQKYLTKQFGSVYT